jgi:hypothetical protein
MISIRLLVSEIADGKEEYFRSRDFTVKAMLARGMKNKDIQFFFNRPDRAVNSGRISTIRVRIVIPQN